MTRGAIFAMAALTGALAFAACGGASAPPAGMESRASTLNAPTPTVDPVALVTVSGAWARVAVGPAPSNAPPMGGMPAPTAVTPAMGGSADTSNSAVYMTIKSTAPVADRLVAARSDIANAVELHTASLKDGVMEMRPVEWIDVPANGTVLLQPGGFHVMLIGLRRDLKLGDVVTLTLRFEKAGTISVDATVKAQGG